MNNSNTTNQRFAKMTFSSVYPLYLTKIEKKGRTKAELHQVISDISYGQTRSFRN